MAPQSETFLDTVWAAVIVFYVTLISVGVLAKRSYPMGTEAARAVLSSEPD